MANSSRVEINSSVTDSLRSVHGVVYVIFYGRIRIPRISGNFGACADSMYQALHSAHEREPGFEARENTDNTVDYRYMYTITAKNATVGPPVHTLK